MNRSPGPDSSSTKRIPPGTYHGVLKSASGRAAEIDLRIDPDEPWASADLMRGGVYFASIRGELEFRGNGWISRLLRVFFEGARASVVGGELDLRLLDEDLVEIDILLPEDVPCTYRGIGSRTSDAQRYLTIEVDRLEHVPAVPRLSTDCIPNCEQPYFSEPQELTVESLMARAGVQVDLQIGREPIPGQQRIGNRALTGPWDKRELHELMSRHSERGTDFQDWHMHLLLLDQYYKEHIYRPVDAAAIEVSGIMFDDCSGDIADSTYARALRADAFQNKRSRQGAAVFWHPFQKVSEDWDRRRRFLATIIHEIGHIFNLPHPFLVQRPESKSFMQYASEYPGDYWREFEYSFDPEELFHIRHGFYQEVIPGGMMEFQKWDPSTSFSSTYTPDPSAARLDVVPSKAEFRFAEPVTVRVSVRDFSPERNVVRSLSPASRHVRYYVRRPDGIVTAYRPPMHRVEVFGAQPKAAEPVGEQPQVTQRCQSKSLTATGRGFMFEAPGEYQIRALTYDARNGALILSPVRSFRVLYPMHDDERIANDLFRKDSALFFYLDGGNHLTSAKSDFEEMADRLELNSERKPTGSVDKLHPIASYAHLVLGLNLQRDQKRPNDLPSKEAGDAACSHFEHALATGHLPEDLRARLNRTLKDLTKDLTTAREQGGELKRSGEG